MFFFPMYLIAAPAEKELTIEERLIQTNIEWSEELGSIADQIDLWLIGDRVTKKRNETRVFLEAQATTKQEAELSTFNNIGAELKLPNLEEHWRLKFSSRNSTEERGQGPRYLQKEPEKKKVGASVGFFRDLGSIHTQYKPRLLLQKQPEISHSLEFSHEADLGKIKFKHELEFFADADLGTGIGHSFSFSQTLSQLFSVRQSNDSRYLDRTHVYNMTSSLSLSQSLTAKMGLSYNIFVSGINRDVYHMNQYGTSISFSHVLYKKILDYSATLHDTFTDDLHFRGLVGFTLATVLNF